MLVAAVALGFSSCEDYPDEFKLADGVPTVHGIKYADSDVLIQEAYMSEIITILGENLCSIHQMYFNDQKALLNTSYMTENAIVLAVPGTIPVTKTDKIYMITQAKDTVVYDFSVLVPGPVLKSMSCEYQPAGTEVTVYGDFFVEPLTLEFADDVPVTEFKSISKTEMTFVIPEGAPAGSLKVTTEYGKASSAFHYMDKRGLITDFDGPKNASSTHGVVPQGWNIKATYSAEDGVDGQYVQLGPSTLSADGAWNEELKLPFWCGNWSGDPMSITTGPGVPICNIIDFSNFQNMGIKFELCIPKENPWSAGAMQIVFTNAQRCANDTWQNNKYIHTSTDGGLDLCRGFYRPWEQTGEFHTDGKWITVTVPFAEFTYNADGTQGKVPLQKPEDFASLIIWPWSGGLNGTECTPIFRIDNIRAVPVK